MITESLRHVLSTYGHANTDISGLAALLRSKKMPSWLGSFHDDFAVAILAGSLTPVVVDELMRRDFDDQAAVDHWLRHAWAIWFSGSAYPR